MISSTEQKLASTARALVPRTGAESAPAYLSPVPVPGTEVGIDFKGLSTAFLRHSWLMVLMALLFGAAGALSVRRVKNVYRSTAVVQVESKEKNLIRVNDDDSTDLKDPDEVQTIVENFRNRSLMQRVITALGLKDDPRFKGSANPVTDEEAIALLQRGVTATIRPHTRLVEVAFSHGDPGVAQRVAAALVDEFLKQGMEQRYSAMETQNAVLVEKSSELRSKLDHSEAALQEYQRNVGSVALENSQTLMTSKLATLNASLSAEKDRLDALDTDLSQIAKAGDNSEALLSIASIAKNPDIAAAKQRVSNQENEISALSQRYRAKHPKMLEAQSQLANFRMALKESLKRAPLQISNERASAFAEMANMQQAIDEQQKSALDLDAKLSRFKMLQREAESDRTLYEAIVQQMKQTTLAMGVQPIAFHVVEPALPPAMLPNRRTMIIGGAVLAGILLGAGIIYLRFALDPTVRTIEEAERLFRLPVLASVPFARLSPGATVEFPVLDRPGSQTAESYRALRTSLAISSSETEPQIILVTSAAPGEGKTITAANIAVSLAKQGFSTLLMDADLRRPSIGALFGLNPDANGLTDWLEGASITYCTTSIANLSILTAGAEKPNPAELLTGPRMRIILDDLRRQFDRIVIDSAPLTTVSDTLNFAALATAVCLVIRAGRTPRQLVKRALDLLTRARVRPAGIALNGLRRSKRESKQYQQYTRGKYGAFAPSELAPPILTAHPRTRRPEQIVPRPASGQKVVRRQEILNLILRAETLQAALQRMRGSGSVNGIDRIEVGVLERVNACRQLIPDGSCGANATI